MKSLFLGLSALLCSQQQHSLFTHAEIRRFEGKIEASPSFIHYSEGFLVTPGFVDISNLVFTTLEEQKSIYGNPAVNTAINVDDDYDEDYGDDKDVNANGVPHGDFDDDDDYADLDSNEKNDIEKIPNKGSNAEGDTTNDNGGDRRSLVTEQLNVEVVLFHEPKNCTLDGGSGLCDWAYLGVGAEDLAGDLRWCCWEDAVDLGLCEGTPNEYGKLIVNKTTFKGQYRSMPIPPTGQKELQFKFGKLPVTGDTGKYVMIVSNCNPNGRGLAVSGKYVWMSEHGYLPGDLFGEMYFNMGMAVFYLALFMFYLIMMKIHKDSAIPIQTYILVTIGIGFFEVFFKAGDYWVWNEDGTRFWFAMYTGVLVGVLKRAISRCLVVMVALGWGVVRDDLNDHMRKIYILGGLYTATSLACDILRVMQVVENEVIGAEVNSALVDSTAILTFVVAAIDVSFYMWILDALSGTMMYLENMSQATKLQRYLRLRLVLLLSILFAVVWAVFGIVNSYLSVRMLEERHEWGVQAAWEVNYFLVLTTVSFLWKPDPTAKEYAYVMELPSMPQDDMNFATNADCDDDDDYNSDDEDADGDLELSDTAMKDNAPQGLKIDDGVDA